MISHSKWHKLLYYIHSGGRNDCYRSKVLSGTIKRLTKVIRQILKNNRFDIIHCHDPIAGYVSQLVLDSSPQKFPVVETVHGPMTYEWKMVIGGEMERSDYLRTLWRIEKESYQKADRIIGVDTGQTRIVTGDFGIDATIFVLIFLWLVGRTAFIFNFSLNPASITL